MSLLGLPQALHILGLNYLTIRKIGYRRLAWLLDIYTCLELE